MAIQPEPFGPGQILSSRRMNSLRQASIRDQQMVVNGPGMSAVGDYMMGAQSSHHAKPHVVLCRAMEDFQQYQLTDSSSFYGGPFYSGDPVWSGKCRLVRLDVQTGLYDQESANIPEFRVWDPLALLTSSESKKEGDNFYAAYNKDTNRVEVIGTGGQTLEIRHGLVSECLGMGWYMVELMDCIQFEPPDCEQYNPWSNSESQSSSASASEGAPEACEQCDFRSPPECEGDSDGVDYQKFCGNGELAIPLRPRRDSKCYPLVGNGTFVYALDKRTVPLKIDGMVTIVWFGDRCLGTSGWESGCGSDSASSSASASEGGSEGAKLYNVVNGEYQMVNIPIKTYECCEDGVVREVGCTTYIVEGMVCVAPETPCPTSQSGSSGSASASQGGGGGGVGGGGSPDPGLDGGP